MNPGERKLATEPGFPRSFNFDVDKLSDRERVELGKPLVRRWYALSREERDAFKVDSSYNREWDAIYKLLKGGDRYGRDLLNQARNEIENENEHGHYWDLADHSLTIIDGGYEVTVSYPYSHPLRVGDDNYRGSESTRTRTKRAAERWAAKKERAYQRYIERVISAGKYDDSGYRRR